MPDVNQIVGVDSSEPMLNSFRASAARTSRHTAVWIVDGLIGLADPS